MMFIASQAGRCFLAMLLLCSLLPSGVASAQSCNQADIWRYRASQRKLQLQLVQLEVRFITVSDSFFDRIGIDFNFDPDTAPCDPEYNGTGDSFPTGTAPTPLPNPFLQSNYLKLPDHTGTTFGMFQLNGPAEIDQFLKAVFAEPDEVVYHVRTLQFGGDVKSIDDPGNNPLLFGLLKMPGLGLTLKSSVTSDQDHVWVSALPFYHGVISGGTFSPITGTMESQMGDPQVQPPVNPQVLARTCTSVTVPDGSALVIGGLYRQPAPTDPLSQVLGQLPLLKDFFKNVGLYGTNHQSMIMITPKILKFN